MIFGGEALELRQLRPWFERHGDAAPRLVNMYGITETTVHVTLPAAARGGRRAGAAAPIGVPIPDLRLYVLDEQRRAGAGRACRASCTSAARAWRAAT